MASSLNSSYCYILHSGSTVFTWSGSLTTSDDQELVERQLDLIKVWQVHCFLLVHNQINRNAAFYGSYLFVHICNGRKASKIFNMYHYALLHFHKCALYNIYIYICRCGGCFQFFCSLLLLFLLCMKRSLLYMFIFTIGSPCWSTAKSSVETTKGKYRIWTVLGIVRRKIWVSQPKDCKRCRKWCSPIFLHLLKWYENYLR